jgi:hypothetical protein
VVGWMSQEDHLSGTKLKRNSYKKVENELQRLKVCTAGLDLNSYFLTKMIIGAPQFLPWDDLEKKR